MLIGDGEVLLDAFIEAYQSVRDCPPWGTTAAPSPDPRAVRAKPLPGRVRRSRRTSRAIALLVLAQRTQLSRLGQSSLLTFTLSAFKVLAYDLRDGEPLVRVVVLALLGLRLYA